MILLVNWFMTESALRFIGGEIMTSSVSKNVHKHGNRDVGV
jgi:hypothetical protein